MGLYDDRLADLSEPRRTRRLAQRRQLSFSAQNRGPSPSEARRPPMETQSLLFDRSKGWTEGKSKAWAQSHGYRYGKVDVTDQYIRIRQFDPQGSKVKRTVPFGRGIRAVVARESSNTMRNVVQAPRRHRRKKSTRKKKTSSVARKRPVKRRRARRARKVHAVAARRRVKTVRVQATRARRRRAAPMVMEAKRKRRSPKRRRRAVRAEAWKGNPAGHRKAARKGWRRKKARKAGKWRRARKVSEVAVAAPRRRRHSRRRVHASVMEAPRRSKRRASRRHRRMYAAKRGSSGMGAAELGMAVVSGGIGFILADGLDRFLATYNPAGTDRPKDKFTSDGAGTLANTLNIAAMPTWKRVVAGIGITVVPAVGSMYVRQPMFKASLEGAAIGAGISAFKTLWNSVVMPMLVGKDTSPAALQKSYIARLYPAEVAAHINLAAQKGADGKQAPGPYSSTGVLSDQTGVGAPAADVGPFALAGDSPYPSAADALRREAGVHDLPTVQNTWGTGGPGSDHPTLAQSMGTGYGNPGQPGMGAWQPGPPSDTGPGPKAQPHTDPSCGCIGDPTIGFAGLLGDAQEESTQLYQ